MSLINASLTIETKPIQEALTAMQVDQVRGQVRFIHPFGPFIGHCEVDDCSEMKSIRCDYYVLCSTYHLHLMTRYIKLTTPLLRVPVGLMSNWTPDQRAVNTALGGASWTYLSPDGLAVVGRSSKFRNLYFNLGEQSGDLDRFKSNAEAVARQVAADMVSREEEGRFPKDEVVPETIRASRW